MVTKKILEQQRFALVLIYFGCDLKMETIDIFH